MPEKLAKGGKTELEIIFEKARAGDRQAKQDFITLYVPCLLKVIRSRRTRKTQSIWDSDDFLQQVRIKVDQFHFIAPA